MADLKKTLLSIQQVLLLIVAVAVVFFAFLNMDPVTIDLFFTTFTTSVALLLLVPLAAGMLLGWVGGRLRASKKAKNTTATATISSKTCWMESRVFFMSAMRSSLPSLSRGDSPRVAQSGQGPLGRPASDDRLPRPAEGRGHRTGSELG